MEAAHRRCCGIDVHKKRLTVQVLPVQGEVGTKSLEREFGTFTRDLCSLREWLKSCRVTEVVMEATGQYWRPVWNMLEDEIPGLMLVNPHHVKALAGRKTDRMDSRRLARYLERGELQGSFIPPRPIRELRDLTRGRVHLVQEVNRVKNRISGICEAGNIKVSSVATDLFGASGRRMLHAVIEGKHAPGWIADYAQGRLRQKRTQLEWALEGTVTEHQRWMLKEALGHLKSLEDQIDRADAQILQRMQPYSEQLNHLTTIPGVDRIVACTILAELGPDMSVFPDAAHAASWAGMCPGNRESAGKQMSGRTRKANSYLRRDLCQAAWAASHTKGTYLMALYRRLRVRCGHTKAIFAVAHQILIIAYQLLRNGEDYKERGEDCFDRRNKTKTVMHLLGRLANLGYEITLLPATPSAVTVALPAQRDSPRRGRGRPCKCRTRGIVCTHKSGSEPPNGKPSDASIPGNFHSNPST
jgi:transposase